MLTPITLKLFIDWYVEHFGSTPSSTEIPTYDEAVASPAYEDFRKNYLEKSLRTGEFNLGRWIAGNDAQRTNEEGNVHHDQLAKDKRNVGQNYGGTTLHDLAVFVATVHTMNALDSASGGSSGSGKKKKEPDVDKRRGKKQVVCKQVNK